MACSLTNRRGKTLWAAVATLVAEGIALVVGRGDCPLGLLQQRLGDPVPLFELVLPRRTAGTAVPVFVGITCVGLAVLAIGRPRLGLTAFQSAELCFDLDAVEHVILVPLEDGLLGGCVRACATGDQAAVMALTG